MLGGLVYIYRIAFRAAGFPGDTAQSNAFLFLPPPQGREARERRLQQIILRGRNAAWRSAWRYAFQKLVL